MSKRYLEARKGLLISSGVKIIFGVLPKTITSPVYPHPRKKISKSKLQNPDVKYCRLRNARDAQGRGPQGY